MTSKSASPPSLCHCAIVPLLKTMFKTPGTSYEKKNYHKNTPDSPWQASFEGGVRPPYGGRFPSSEGRPCALI